MQTKVLTRHMTPDRLTQNRCKALTEVSSNTLTMQTSITQGLIQGFLMVFFFGGGGISTVARLPRVTRYSSTDRCCQQGGEAP